jgi:hypothetical protein
LDEHKKPIINIKCLMDGDDLCAVADQYRGGYLHERPLLTEDGYTCLTTDGVKLDCARDRRVFNCIAHVSPEVFSAKPMMLDSADTAKMHIVKHRDRNSACAHAAPGLALVGDVIKVTQDQKVRSSIGGKAVGTAKTGQEFQVLDYEVRLGTKTERFYKIRLEGKGTGFISGGTDADAAKFAVTVQNGAKTTILIPREGSKIEIARKGGIALKDAPGDKSKQLQMVPAKTSLVVTQVVTLDTANELWLAVQVGKQKGFIYAGRTYPSVTVSDWVKVTK